ACQCVELLAGVLKLSRRLLGFLPIELGRLGPRRSGLIKKPIIVLRVADENFGTEGRGPANEDKRFQSLWGCCQEAQKIGSVGNIAEEAFEVIESSVRVGRLTGGFQKPFHHARQNMPY